MNNINTPKKTCDCKLVWKDYKDLSKEELYLILKLRQDIFIVEQDCIYPDIDGEDNKCIHLLVFDKNKKSYDIIAYLRVFPPAVKHKEASIGRVMVNSSYRKKGLGKIIIKEALDYISKNYGADIKISAQVYLLSFYKDFSFYTISDEYDEDGILHIDMLRKS